MAKNREVMGENLLKTESINFCLKLIDLPGEAPGTSSK